MTEEMHNAVLALQERMANLDHQWQRAIMLDTHGIFVYDEQGPNKGRPDVWLSRKAKWWNDGQVRNYVEERRLIMATCDLPRLGTAPPPRVEAAASATSSHPNDYPDNRTPTPPRRPGRAPTRRSPNRSPPNNRHREAGMERLERGRSRRRGRRRSLDNTHHATGGASTTHTNLAKLDQPYRLPTSNRPTR